MIDPISAIHCTAIALRDLGGVNSQIAFLRWRRRCGWRRVSWSLEREASAGRWPGAFSHQRNCSFALASPGIFVSLLAKY